jgi:4-hydroxybutyrate CoA-transferase
MAREPYPAFFAERIFPHDQALRLTVTSGTRIAAGFATSEPVSFYRRLWDHILENNLTDLTISQGLYMAPYPFCLGNAMSARGRLQGWDRRLAFIPPLARAAKNIHDLTRKLDGVSKLVAHYEEKKRRRIRGVSGFLGPTDNIVIPDNFITRHLFPEYAGRNSSRMGITDFQSIHFPDAASALAFDPDTGLKFDLFVTVMTPPDQNGEMSLGPANGANGEMLERIFNGADANLLLYINPNYPFTRGYGPYTNTGNIERGRRLAEAGRLFVVEDNAPVPSLPAGSFDNPAPEELAIADNLVNHIELHKDFTFGRAIQVGIGNSGVCAIKKLKDSSWHGREYSEMLEPFTLELFEAGKIAGSHFIEEDGRRTMLDGKLVATFSMGEAGSDFYHKLDHNDAIVMAAAARVVRPEAFFHGLGINNVLGIDFQGHVNSGGRDKNHHSGIGGGAIIMRGLAHGGVGYLCLKSTHQTVEGKLRSSIFPFLPQGTPISLVGPDLWGTRHNARTYLVTEHGIARLSSHSQANFIRSLISVAHPHFRDELARQAWKEFRVKI